MLLPNVTGYSSEGNDVRICLRSSRVSESSPVQSVVYMDIVVQVIAFDLATYHSLERILFIIGYVIGHNQDYVIIIITLPLQILIHTQYICL